MALLACAATDATAARFTDTFSTSPGAPRRHPFTWDGFYSLAGTDGEWRIVDGVLDYNTANTKGRGASVTFASAGTKIDDDTAWSLEVGFRHIEGTALKPAYEVLTYVTWFAKTAGQMRILALMYDAHARALVMLNGSRSEERVAVDLAGKFHAVRMTVADRQWRVYIDGEVRAGPLALRTRQYAQAPVFYIGPITRPEPHTLHCQFDYFAFTDDGAFAPGSAAGWTPALDKTPVAEGLTPMRKAVEDANYAGIELLKREKGSDLWLQLIPDHWRKLRAIIRTEPRQLDVPFYTYEGKPTPSRQNVYHSYMALKYGEKRCVAVGHRTRGVDDTPGGFIDYKRWYRVSTDGGETYDAELPLVQEGAEYSPMHPIKYVWIGKNSFCYAAVPPFLRMSNGEVLLPFYFAPLDEDGDYHNPVGAYTFTYAAALIGKWNDSGDDLIWEASQDIRLSGEQSSRGANECAVIELPQPGHIFMVIRGSNHPNPTGTIPAVKWKTLSTDYGRTWSECTPFTYCDGTELMSPSSCSSFIRSSRTGKVYWIGNISRVLPRGNSPRYPLIMAELDEETLGLRKDTITIIDDREPTDPQDVQFSNFKLIEDPATGHIVLGMSRYMSAEHRHLPGHGSHTYVVAVR